jgi:hypothetical protein
VADELPRPSLVFAGVQVDSCAIVAPAVASAHDSTSWVAGQRLSELCKSWLSAHAPAVDLVAQVRDVLPGSAAIGTFKNREVSRRVTRKRSSGDNGTIL